jgi:Arc/MetJ family transcription regulator
VVCKTRGAIIAGVSSVGDCNGEEEFRLECVTIIKFIHLEIVVRTNIVIDDTLMEDALKATGLKTKKEAVELGLKTLIRLKQQEDIKALRGKLKWEGDLEDMRTAQ